MPAIEMPHALKFFRAHSNSIDLNTKRPDKKSLRALSGAGGRPALKDRSVSQSSHTSDGSSASDANMRNLSIANAKGPAGRIPPQPASAKLALVIESPPLVFIGPSASSTGALLSGLLQVKCLEEKVAFKSVQLKLVISIRQKKPFHQHCPECAQQNVDLKVWDFFPSERELTQGQHDIPFSHMLAGHLPITMHGQLSVIDYILKAYVVPLNGAPIFLQKELNVKRAIAPSELPKQSIRIFPPTNLTAHIQMPQVIHPIGEFLCEFRLDGVIKKNLDTHSQTQWKLKRLNWRVEETQKGVSPACEKHALKAGGAPGQKKGMAHTEIKLLNSDELKSGWKCDYGSGADGSIEMQFPFSLNGPTSMDPVCDVKAEDGTEVTHSLIVEMIVAEEFAPMKKPQQATPTGAARVLRMHFNLVVTERLGMGISWDEEQPPLYDDVPPSPPQYANGAGPRAPAAAAGRHSPEISSGHGQVEVYDGTPLPDLHGTPIPRYEDLDGIDALDLNGPSHGEASHSAHMVRPSPLHQEHNSYGMWQAPQNGEGSRS